MKKIKINTEKHHLKDIFGLSEERFKEIDQSISSIIHEMLTPTMQVGIKASETGVYYFMQKFIDLANTEEELAFVMSVFGGVIQRLKAGSLLSR